MELSARQIAECTGGNWTPPGEMRIRSVSTDTRAIAPGDLFVALKGQRYDAHDYLDQAARAGAAAIVADQPDKVSALRNDHPQLPILAVPDTLHALGDIAAAWRTQCPAQRISVVGSSGKTTTKDMLATILQAQAPTLATAGNYNNLIGLPQTLFQLTPEHRYAVLELGMNLPGELTRLTHIAQPDLLLFLNIGRAHIGQFGSKTALVEAKAEAVQALRPDIPVIYNQGCPNCRAILERWGGERPALAFDVEKPADVWADAIHLDPPNGYRFRLHAGSAEAQARIQVFGRYNVANAVAAAAAAHAVGIPLDQIAQGLAQFHHAALRSEIREIGGVHWIVDCYNASPDGMREALASFEDFAQGCKGRAFLVLGEMRELGQESKACHEELARQVADMPVDGLYVMGDAMQPLLEAWPAQRHPAKAFDDHADLATELKQRLRPGDCVFLKSSRALALEKLLDHFQD